MGRRARIIVVVALTARWGRLLSLGNGFGWYFMGLYSYYVDEVKR